MVKQIPIEYEGENSVESLMNFLNVKTSIKKSLITNAEELNNAIVDNIKATAIYFGDENTFEADEFYLVQLPYENVNYRHIVDKDLAKNFGFNDGQKVAIFFEGEKKFYGGNLNFLEIGEFIEKNMFPLVNVFSFETLDFILDEETYSGSLVVILEDQSKIEETKILLKEVYQEFENQISVSYALTSDKIINNILKFFALNLEEIKGNKVKKLIKVVFVKYEAFAYKRFILEKEYTKQNILDFLNGIKEKTIKPKMRSQPVPAGQNTAVESVVALNYQESVIDSPQDVMIMFVSSKCEACKNLHIEYLKLAEQLKVHNPNIKMAIIDAKENDIEGFDIRNIPTVFYIPSTTKIPLEIKTSELTGSLLLNVMKKNTSHPWVLLPLEEEINGKEELNKDEEKIVKQEL